MSIRWYLAGYKQFGNMGVNFFASAEWGSKAWSAVFLPVFVFSFGYTENLWTGNWCLGIEETSESPHCRYNET
jgi:hypothetical protein